MRLDKGGRMKLCRLLNRVVVFEVYGDVTTEVVGLAHNTGEIGEDSLFFCLSGKNKDGHDYAYEAVNNGASVVVTERYISGLEATQVIVKNARSAMSIMAQNFYDNPADKMKLIAVTGTNGKTSVCYIIRSILDCAGKKCGIIGTNGIWIQNEYFDCDLTTPDPIVMNSTLALMRKKEIEYVVFEASAHAIYLDKLEGIVADVGIFTNISQDHLDFFKNMESYTATKEKYFCHKYMKTAVVNTDDAVGLKLYRNCKIPTIGYGTSSIADVRAEKYAETAEGQIFSVSLENSKVNIKSRLKGVFNMYNIVAAVTACQLLGIKTTAITQGISEIEYIDGRNMRLEKNGVTVVVDFAHTPDGVKNILGLLKNETKGALITVFGCGGDRDKDKREIMAKEASVYSNLIILTEDNPRSEKTEDIICQMQKGVSVACKVVLNRKKAIIEALKTARVGDVVAILGKGAEKYIIRNDEKEKHNDFDYVAELMNVYD